MIGFDFFSAALSVAFSSCSTIANESYSVPKLGGQSWVYRQTCGTRIRMISSKHISNCANEFEISVWPQDKVGGWSGERAEVSNLKGGTGVSQGPNAGTREFYGVSVKLDKEWIAPKAKDGYSWGIIFQLHGPAEFRASPSFALMAEEVFSIGLAAGDIFDSGKRDVPRGLVKYEIMKAREYYGKWVYFILDISWSRGRDGRVVVYVMDKGSRSWKKVLEINNTPTLQYRNAIDGAEHYWKAGFYRSESDFVSKLHFGDIYIGRSFSDVDEKLKACFRG